MAIIEGQIEPLKKLREILHHNGITRFGSVGEINEFIKHYEAEKNEIPAKIESEFEREVNQLQINLLKYQQDYDFVKEYAANEINQKIKELEERLVIIREKGNKTFIHKIFFYPKTKFLIKEKESLGKNFEDIVGKKIHNEEKEVFRIKEKLNDYTTNKHALISGRCLRASNELERTKDVIESLYNLIAGAVGESSVIKEVQKLSDNFHLFNDYSVQFNPPIYNKKENDRIYSIQIDHLLVCEAGIFILETKNWGKQSVENIDLRSPVKQVLRSSYAVFVLVNGQSRHIGINLKDHHWGSKQIPVRNLIVMTSAKPKEDFKHVKVLSLQELNGYLTYFDPVFNSEEVKSICNYLRRQMS